MNTIYRLISTIIDLTSLDRYGKQSSSTYGKIDDLTCSYDGNHLTAISDNAPIPTISGSFDFKDEASTTAEYLYDENGLRPDVTKGNNNRVVVAENDSIVQINHYYPYGGVIGDISTLLSDVTKGNNENVQKYKFEGPRSHQKEIDNLLARRRAFRRGVELDRTFGLDNYDIHARQYFAMMPSWDRIDPLAEKYYGISPYVYCGGDPVNFGDYNGRDLCVLIQPNGASGVGHMAILIQKDDGMGNKHWFLFSKNGSDGSSSSSGPAYSDDIYRGRDKNNNSTLGFNSVEDFLNSGLNQDEEGNVKYTEGYLLICDTEQDIKASSGAIELIGNLEDFKDYHLLWRNCAQTVQKALSNAGFQIGTPSVADMTLREITGAPARDLSDLFPNVIYERIKQQNSGKVISL